MRSSERRGTDIKSLFSHTDPTKKGNDTINQQHKSRGQERRRETDRSTDVRTMGDKHDHKW